MAIMSNVRWRDIPGWEGFYQVSNQGDVRSVRRVAVDGLGRTRTWPDVDLRATPTSNGRRSVQLSRDGVARTALVAHLVAAAFIGPRPEGMDVCHNDGDRANDELSNLRYDTRSANLLDAVAHGTNVNAAKTDCARGHALVWRGGKRPQRWCPTCRRDKRRGVVGRGD